AAGTELVAQARVGVGGARDRDVARRAASAPGPPGTGRVDSSHVRREARPRGLLLATAVITIVTARMGRPLFTFAAVCAPMALILAYETSIFVPAFNRSFDVKSFSQRLATKLAPEARLVTLGVGALPVEFYSHRSARAVRHPMEVEESLQDGG